MKRQAPPTPNLPTPLVGPALGHTPFINDLGITTPSVKNLSRALVHSTTNKINRKHEQGMKCRLEGALTVFQST